MVHINATREVGRDSWEIMITGSTNSKRAPATAFITDGNLVEGTDRSTLLSGLLYDGTVARETWVGEVGKAAERYLHNYPTDMEMRTVWTAAYEEFLDLQLSNCRIADASHDRPRKLSVFVVLGSIDPYVCESLEDLNSQTIAQEIEIIVVDTAGSEEQSLRIENFQRKHRNVCHICTPSPMNDYRAWNMAVRIAGGEYVTPLGGDSCLSPDAYEILLSELEHHPWLALVYGDSFTTTAGRSETEVSPSLDCEETWIRPGFTYERLLSDFLIGPHPMWRKSLHKSEGYFSENFGRFGDLEFHMRIGISREIRHVEHFIGVAGAYDNARCASKKIEPDLLRLQSAYQNILLRRAHVADFASETPAQAVRHLFENSYHSDRLGVDYVDGIQQPPMPLTFHRFSHVLGLLVSQGNLDGAVRYFDFYRCLFRQCSGWTQIERIMNLIRETAIAEPEETAVAARN